MIKIEWNDNLSVDGGLIDEQHKKLIKRLNDVSEAVENKQGPNIISKTLSFLLDYTDFHFSTEEKHMKKHNFPGFQEHHIAHEQFKEPLTRLEEDFKEEGATNALAEALDSFLVNWLIVHIENMDQIFGKFVKEQGLKLS